jgi:CHAT domain-containing protein/tetratricopeptide (TPR) repeat protein
MLWAAGAVAAEEPLPVRIDALMEARRYAEARPLVERWCRELAGRSGAQAALEEARARHVLGSVLDRLGDSAGAVVEMERALVLYERGGAGEAERAAALDEAGRAAQAAGRFDQADAWLAAAAEARSGEPALAAGSRAQRADVLMKLGRLVEAAAELQVAASLAGDDPAARWQVERQLGMLAQTTGRYGEALQHFDRALDWAGRMGGSAGPLLASLQGQRGQVLARLGRSEEAARVLEQAADFFRDVPGAVAEWMAQENNLAAVWLGAGEPVRARDRLRAVLGSPAAAALGDSPVLITPWLNARAAEWATGGRDRAEAALDRAAGLAETSLPEVHPLRAQVAVARLAKAVTDGDTETARAEAQRASDQARAWLGRLGGAAAESEWLDFRRTLDPVSPLAVVGREEPERLADAVLATQGLGLDRLLAGPGAKLPERPGWREVVTRLPAGAVLVNFVWWRPLGADGEWATDGHYGALVLRSGRSPVWTDLGPAAEIEARVRRVIHAARDTVSTNRAASNRASLDFQSRHLWELVWEPLAKLVDDADSLVLRPDGMLHFVPWAILREPKRESQGAGEGQWFCQKYRRVRVVARAADAPAAPTAAGGWRLVAVTEAPGSEAPAPPAEGSPDLSPEVWREILAMPKLPGAARERDAIRAAAPPTVEVVVAPPREEAFVPPRPAVPPAVLHFSGHGFAVDQQDEWGVPRLEAGLVFSGCADGLRARMDGRPLAPRKDGILFAREVATLNLEGTELVMLSACQTGLGHWQPGEHLTGLRHAFIVAGARFVATALWDVSDEAAPAFIEAFYRRLGAGADPDEALWATQREWLEAPSDMPAVRAALAGAWVMEAAGW